MATLDASRVARRLALSAPRRPRSLRASAAAPASSAAAPERLTIRRPDDWHLHVRDGAGMRSVVPHSAAVFGRALIMPNLVPPVTTADMARAYADRVSRAAPADAGFTPLPAVYLTDRTSPKDVEEARAAGAIAYKLYPAGATTNSDSGVTDVAKVEDALARMAELDMPLCVHGEVTDPSVDVFDRERVFLERVLLPLLDRVPALRVVLEHVTTADAAELVAQRTKDELAKENQAPNGAANGAANEHLNGAANGAANEHPNAAAPLFTPRLAATVTPQHMLWNRNELFRGGLRPHAYCLPVLKRERHRRRIAELATAGLPCFFLGTDSAPHARGRKEASCGCAGVYSAPVALPLYALAFERQGNLAHLEAFASLNGPAFYRLAPNEQRITLAREPWRVPDAYSFGDDDIVPMWAGEELPWKVLEE